MKKDEKIDFRITDLNYINDIAKMITEFNAKFNCRRIEKFCSKKKSMIKEVCK